MLSHQLDFQMNISFVISLKFNLKMYGWKNSISILKLLLEDNVRRVSSYRLIF